MENDKNKNNNKADVMTNLKSLSKVPSMSSTSHITSSTTHNNINNPTNTTNTSKDGREPLLKSSSRSSTMEDLESGETSSSMSVHATRARHRARHRRPWYRRFIDWFTRKQPSSSREIYLGTLPDDYPTEATGLFSIRRKKRRHPVYAPNIVRNQKYRASTFLLVVLWNQFKYFFNLYFLMVCITQFFPIFRVTYIFTNVVPLALVLSITLTKEAYDDYHRYLRDKEANSQLYGRLQRDGSVLMVPSSDLAVGDVIIVHKDQRVPADVVLLKTHDPLGTIFVRTDQLDGEIDWKLRVAVPVTQKTTSDAQIFQMQVKVFAEAPHKDIHYFVGTLRYSNGDIPNINRSKEESVVISLNVENTLWMNTVVASGTAYGLVVYTGRDTRAVMNTCKPETKDGLTDQQLNSMSKVLCLILVILSFLMVAMKGWQALWLIYFVRFVVLFSTIIPLSLRVNLDMGKSFCSSQISKDEENIPGTIVRSSTIPEELGRVNFLLTDKTGTLTMNDMTMRTVHLGTVGLGIEDISELRSYIQSVVSSHYNIPSSSGNSSSGNGNSHNLGFWGRRDLEHRVFTFTMALALCHNVTPVYEEETEEGNYKGGSRGPTYQASSPDEIAIVKWTEAVGLSLVQRDRHQIVIKAAVPQLSPSSASPSSSREEGMLIEYDIEFLFPFSSESKRMGIIVRERASGEYCFYEKGADTVMQSIVQRNDWMREESSKMAEQGLRTLVIGRKRLSVETFEHFQRAYQEANTTMTDRPEALRKVMAEYLENDLELLGVTGVEDRLQDQVKHTLERLRSAKIRVWMLTGDKVETAKCIAVSSSLFDLRSNEIIDIIGVTSFEQAESRLDYLVRAQRETNPFLGNQSKVLVIDGSSLQLYLEDPELARPFFRAASALPAVVCCRCSPTQKAQVARQIQRYTKARVACIGDGGNDVSMIQAANVGIGIVGKEGRQASLAADFSITQFSHLALLLLWHGRNSYKRTAKVSQFVIHRGFIIAIMQAVFSAVLYFSPIALYQGILSIGYTTIYTMAPVFSLILDTDITPALALTFPELYAELRKGRELNWKTFFQWLAVSTYQGGILMVLALWLFEQEFIHIVSITFTALILNELLMIALEAHTWHWLMVVAEVTSIVVYIISIRLLPDEFDIRFTTTWTFVWKVTVMTLASFAPIFLYKIIKQCVNPPSYRKLLSST